MPPVFHKYAVVMLDFQYYCTDFDLYELCEGNECHFRHGVICQIDGVTHLAISVPSLKQKLSDAYAVFRWDGVDCADRDKIIEEANNLADSLLRFANSTVETAANGMMRFPRKVYIQSVFCQNLCEPIDGEVKSEEETPFNVRMVETGTNQESTWTMQINDSDLATFNNEDSAKKVYLSLCESLKQYVRAWMRAFKKGRGA